MASLAPRSGLRTALPARSSRQNVCRPVASSGKVDIKKQGLESIDNEVVKQNMMGRSRFMKSKNWVDPQGRKGKVGRVEIGRRS